MSTVVRRAAPPSRVLFKLVNPVMRAVLRSPLHSPVSGSLLLLYFKGHKSGRRFEIPVAYHDLGDGALTVFTGSTWQHNFEGRAPVASRLRGRLRRGRAERIADPAQVATAFQQVLSRIGWRKARRLGLELTVDREPTYDELLSVTPGQAIIRLHLED